MTLFPDLFQQNDLNQAISLVPDIQANRNNYTTTITQNSSSAPINQWKFIMEYRCIFALSPKSLQHNLHLELMKATQFNTINLADLVDRFRITSWTGIGAAAFLWNPTAVQGGYFTNLEFQIAVKIRIN